MISARCLCLISLLGTISCAQAELASYTFKRMQAPAPGAVTSGAGSYKIGDPYQVGGVWYYPKVEYDYRETGIASWYGPGFHGRKTANGEIYDQDGLTAAHRTLPLPSMVRVTNLENGRSLVVRVNDRGPFKSGRIIDLSRRAAQLLKFVNTGTAKVEVEVLETESRQVATLALRDEAAAKAPAPAPVVPVKAARLPSNGSHTLGRTALAAPRTDRSESPATPPRIATPIHIVEPRLDGRVSRQPVTESKIYVQAGAFLRRDNAARLSARLSTMGATSISEKKVEDRLFYRVRLGPLDTVDAADSLLNTLLANGYNEVAVVVD